MVSIAERGTLNESGSLPGLKVLDDVHQQLHQAVPEFYQQRGVDFDSLPPVEQHRLALDFIERLQRLELRHYFLERQRQCREIHPHSEININLRNVEIKIAGEDKLIVLGPKTERMLAFFTALTETKVYQCFKPLVTRKELALVVDVYKQEQLYDHLLRPLSEAGFLRVDEGRGYWLNCAPSTVWKILQGNEFHYEVEVEDVDNWLKKEYPGAVLVGQHQQNMLKAVWTQVRASLSKDDPLDLDRLEKQTGLGHDRVYKNLRELEEAGIICRQRFGDLYKISDILDTGFLEEVVKRQKGTKKIEVSPPDSYTARLAVAKQTEIDFPEVSWGVPANFEKRPLEEKLELLDQVLTAPLESVVYEEAGERYLLRLPAGELQKVTQSVLQFLGIGPKELDNLLKDRNCPSLAAAITALEEKAKNGWLPVPGYGLLLTRIKSAILTLVYGEEVAPEIAGGWEFKQVIGSLGDSLSSKAAA